MKNLLIKGLMSVLIGAVAFPLAATVLEELTFEQLVANSELIFEGKVLGVEVSTDNELVYSTVSFAVNEIHKGEGLVQDEFKLRFLGGNDSSLVLEVEGQYVPVTGEHGLYFVSDIANPQVNPLTGWGQGYFPIFAGEDGNAYLDLRNHPHYAFLDGGENPLVKKMQGLNFSKDAINSRFPKSEQFPLEDFVAAVQSLLEE
jgi:hypothetical protein